MVRTTNDLAGWRRLGVPGAGLAWAVAAAAGLSCWALGGCESTPAIIDTEPARASLTIRNDSSRPLRYRLDRGLRAPSGVGLADIDQGPNLTLAAGQTTRYVPPPWVRNSPEAEAVYQLELVLLDVSWKEPRRARYELVGRLPMTIVVTERSGQIQATTNGGSLAPVPTGAQGGR
ncbi:MAG: hypothetical protein IBJ11_06395 [Phycisphaerales bacterium]|nr:hypothetical protein [Phycisphaerales bacterium]